MNVALRRPMTQAEFFDWAEAQDGPFEFDGLRPIAMTGGNLRHAVISGNLHGQLYLRLRGMRCRPIASEFGGGVATGGGTVRYPDAAVTCSSFSGRDRLVPDPVVVFEILSPTSRQVDLTIKPAEYGSVPSIVRYVILEQDRAELHGYTRTQERGWSAMPPLGPTGTLELPEISIELSVAEIYEGVSFDQ